MKASTRPFRLILSRFRRLNYRHVLPDAVLILICLYGALFLRLDSGELPNFLPTLNRLVPLFLSIRLITFTMTGVYDIIWRYVSLDDAVRLVRGILVSSVLILATSFLVDIGRLPRAVFFIDTFLLILLLTGMRFARRQLNEARSGRQLRRSGRRTLIYGAGVFGRSLVHHFQTDSSAGMKVVGFIDDNPQKIGRLVSGFKVLGSRHDLAEIIRDYNLTDVVVSTHTVRGEILREVTQTCLSAGIELLLVTEGPAIGSKPSGLTREIGLGDLLNRPRRQLDVGSIRELLHNRRVLVTGAGGSIGSELSRQILSYAPSHLMLLDHSEFNLYQIDQELQEVASATRVIPLLSDIKDRQTLSNLFAQHQPEIVIHAAAYKHVHLVETNPYPSILNNILGTQNLVELSTEFPIRAFVLISSDKAVNPAGVMGATKRVCELIVSEAGRRTGRRFCSVRFGNVLGSSGSLIPRLKQQIENGGPVTITHKDMTRYFMLIPEAGALVLKAATIAEPGDITVLRMGEPLRIVDVAQSLIALMGRSLEEVPMVFTGLRPGEKLFEELYLCGNETNTEDPDILIMPKGDLGSWDSGRAGFQAELAELVDRARLADPKSVAILSAIVNSNYIHPLSIETESGAFLSASEIQVPSLIELH